MILVTGATGRVGSEIVRALVAARAPVRAFVRDRERAAEILGPDVELAVGDFGDRSSVRAALDGVDALLLSCADDPRRVDWERAAIDEAIDAGVGRVVKLSTIGAAPDAPVAFWQWHGLVEDYLRASGAPFVVLRSSFSMSNPGLRVAPDGTARVAMVDPRDVGAAAAMVLQGVGEDGRTYTLTGPAAESLHVPEEGVPPELVALFRELRRGAAAEVTGDVEELTGRSPFAFTAQATITALEAVPE